MDGQPLGLVGLCPSVSVVGFEIGHIGVVSGAGAGLDGHALAQGDGNSTLIIACNGALTNGLGGRNDIIRGVGTGNRRHSTACNRDAAGIRFAGIEAGADTGAVAAADSNDGTAGDADGTGNTGVARAADTRAPVTAGGGNGAAGNRDTVPLVLFTGANAGTAVAAGGVHDAAIDNDCTAIAANAGAVVAAGGGDAAAIDGDGAHIAAYAAANAGVTTSAGGNQSAGGITGALGVDGQAFAGGNSDALLRGQRSAVAENQVDIAISGNELADGGVFADYIPARGKLNGFVGALNGGVAPRQRLLVAVFVQVLDTRTGDGGHRGQGQHHDQRQQQSCQLLHRVLHVMISSFSPPQGAVCRTSRHYYTE